MISITAGSWSRHIAASTRQYHRSVRDLAQRFGALLYSHAAIVSVAQQNGHAVVTTARGVITARHVIAATNGYSTNVTPLPPPRVISTSSYMIASEPLPPEQMETLLPKGRIVSDSQRNLFFVRPSPDGTRILFGARPSAYDRPETAIAGLLHKQLTSIWLEMGSVKISHCWRGQVAMTFDHTPHIGQSDGLYFAAGCNGSGIAMMSYLGQQIAQRLLGRQNRPSAFETPRFPTRRWYKGRPWFLPLISTWYDLRDGIDRRFH